MSNKKFSEFTLQTDNSNVAFVVGFNGSDNVRISPSNLIGSGFLPVSGGTMTGNLLLQDNIQLQIGTGADLKLYHNATDSFIENQTGILKIQSSVTDGDIQFLSDNGSGTATTYFQLDGGQSQTRVFKNFKFEDDVKLLFGTSDDLKIFHETGSTSKIENYTGNLTIQQRADDSDIVFQCDDGSGGLTEYFRVDGSTLHTNFSKPILLDDNVNLKIGTGQDMELRHDGTDSYIQNSTGHINIINLADDKDIIFKSDDGGGGITEYFKLDGTNKRTKFSEDILITDDKRIRAGSGADFSFFHDGSNSKINNNTGNIVVENFQDDGDISFKTDDGTGSTTEYFRLDGGDTITRVARNFRANDNVALQVGVDGDAGMYHDGTNTYFQNDTGNLILLQNTNDGDIIFKSDNGSGGTTTYMTIDGGSENVQFAKSLFLYDNIFLNIGGSFDLRLYHDGNSNIKAQGSGDLIIAQTVDDGDIIFKCDDGSGGITEYFRLDGSLASGGSVFTVFPDNSSIVLGTGNDLQAKHNGTDTTFDNYTGDLKFQNYADDKDIVFSSDDGSGGITEYLKLDGSNPTVVFSKSSIHTDNIGAYFGTGLDLQIYHDATDSFLLNTTGDLYLRNLADDKDINFQSDDGSGGFATYFRVDGSTVQTRFLKSTLHFDNVGAKFGDSGDMELYHDGSHSYLKQSGTGDLYIQQFRNDGDIVFQSDDGSGGMATYFKLDGSTVTTVATKQFKFEDDIKLFFGTGADSAIYASSDNLIIEQTTDDKDIIFKSDDGSGGVTEYFRVDGGSENVLFSKILQLSDSVEFRIGDGNDLRIKHDGTDTFVENENGDFYIRNKADDKDIIFQSDDGSGGTTEYFKLDGSFADSTFRYTVWTDNSIVALGANADLSIYHNATNSIISNSTGNLTIQNTSDDKDIIFKSDDGSGGLMTYLTIDGGAGLVNLPDNIPLAVGTGNDFKITHNATNSTIQNLTGNLTIRNDQNDGDIELACDDGSGGVTPYLTLDGGITSIVANKDLLMGVDGDGGKIKLGASQDLQIFHDGSNSRINEVGTGNLIIQATNYQLLKDDGGEFIMQGIADAEVSLYYNGSKKFETTSSGVDVTGRMDINDGNENVSIGDNAGDALSTGERNVAIGHASLGAEDTGSRNTAVGWSSLNALNFNGNGYNSAFGYASGLVITTGVQNSLVGASSGQSLTTGSYNTAFGYRALYTEDTGNYSVAVGYRALLNQNYDGSSYNVAVGTDAGTSITTGVQNTIIGAAAGDALTTGTNNVAVGFEALSTEDEHSFNVAVGHRALKNQNAGASAYNTALGYNSGLNITTGVQNTLIGGLSGDALTTGGNNVALGYASLSATTIGTDNIAIGKDALQINVNGSASVAIGSLALEDQAPTGTGNMYNIAIGHHAGKDISTGTNNTLIGGLSGDALNTGNNNIAMGYASLSAETKGDRSVAIGNFALQVQNNTTNADVYNTAVGYAAGAAITTGTLNTIIGGDAGKTITTGDSNVLIGYEAGEVLLDGGQNTLLGDQVAGGLTSGDENTYIGRRAASSATTGNNNVAIGAGSSLSSATVSNEVNISNGSVTARFQGAASAWTFVSDERDKKEIEDLELGLDFIDKLKPRKFKWDLRDSDTDKGKESSGFIAQEIKEVLDETGVDYTGIVDTNNPDQYTVAQANIIPMLVKAIQELKQEIEQLKNK